MLIGANREGNSRQAHVRCGASNSGVEFDKCLDILDLWREGRSRIEVIEIAIDSERFWIISTGVGVYGVN